MHLQARKTLRPYELLKDQNIRCKERLTQV